MEKANVLVMGNSGTGKSTLINSVFRFDRAKTGDGPSVTKEMAVYETGDVPFRCIDTRGLEYGLAAQINTRNAIRKWSRSSVKSKKEDRYIHLIWYCLDATSKRIFKKNLETLQSVSHLWKDIPILIVLTKSYSQIEQESTEAMVAEALDSLKKNKLNVKGIVSVVARPYRITEEIIIPPRGLDELIAETNCLIPEALRLNKLAVTDFELRMKTGSANALTAAATLSAAAIGAVPIPIADSALLVPLQSALVLGITKIYGMENDDAGARRIAEVMIQSGIISAGARNLLSGLKAIPGINIAAEILNALVAGTITAIIGGTAAKVMEKIARGELDAENLDWIKKFAESEIASQAAEYLKGYGKDVDKLSVRDIGKLVVSVFEKVNKKKK